MRETFAEAVPGNAVGHPSPCLRWSSHVRPRSRTCAVAEGPAALPGAAAAQGGTPCRQRRQSWTALQDLFPRLRGQGVQDFPYSGHGLARHDLVVAPPPGHQGTNHVDVATNHRYSPEPGRDMTLPVHTAVAPTPASGRVCTLLRSRSVRKARASKETARCPEKGSSSR